MAVTFDVPPDEADATDNIGSGKQQAKGKQPRPSSLTDQHQRALSPHSHYEAQLQRLQQVIDEIEEQRYSPNSLSRFIRRIFGCGCIGRHLELGPSWLNVAVTFRVLALGASISVLTLVVVLASADGIFCWGWLAAGMISLLADLVGASLPLFKSVENRFPAVAILTILDAFGAAVIATFSVPELPSPWLLGPKHAHQSEEEQESDYLDNELVTVLKVFIPSMVAVRVFSIALTFATRWYNTKRKRREEQDRPLLLAEGLHMSGSTLPPVMRPLPVYA